MENEQIIYIEFGKSSSAKYKRALSLAKSMPNYSYDGRKHKFYIDDIKDYLIHRDDLSELARLVYKWKSAKVLIFGEEYSTVFVCQEWLKRLKKQAGKYYVMLENQSDVAMGAITIEDLPLPVVYYPPLYGCFFAFSKDIGETVYLCECEREAVENYVKLRNQRKRIAQYSTTDTSHFPDDDIFPPIITKAAADN